MYSQQLALRQQQIMTDSLNYRSISTPVKKHHNQASGSVATPEPILVEDSSDDNQLSPAKTTTKKEERPRKRKQNSAPPSGSIIDLTHSDTEPALQRLRDKSPDFQDGASSSPPPPNSRPVTDGEEGASSVGGDDEPVEGKDDTSRADAETHPTMKGGNGAGSSSNDVISPATDQPSAPDVTDTASTQPEASTSTQPVEGANIYSQAEAMDVDLEYELFGDPDAADSPPAEGLYELSSSDEDEAEGDEIYILEQANQRVKSEPISETPIASTSTPIVRSISSTQSRTVYKTSRGGALMPKSKSLTSKPKLPSRTGRRLLPTQSIPLKPSGDNQDEIPGYCLDREDPYFFPRRSDGGPGRVPDNSAEPPEPDADGNVNYMHRLSDNAHQTLLWKRKLGKWIAKYLLKHPNALNGTQTFYLAQFPEFYVLLQQRKGTAANPRKDCYLYGSRRVQRFRSPREFWPHLIWLLARREVEDGRKKERANCACIYCHDHRVVLRRRMGLDGGELRGSGKGKKRALEEVDEESNDGDDDDSVV